MFFNKEGAVPRRGISNEKAQTKSQKALDTPNPHFSRQIQRPLPLPKKAAATGLSFGSPFSSFEPSQGLK